MRLILFGVSDGPSLLRCFLCFVPETDPTPSPKHAKCVLKFECCQQTKGDAKIAVDELEQKSDERSE